MSDKARTAFIISLIGIPAAVIAAVVAFWLTEGSSSEPPPAADHSEDAATAGAESTDGVWDEEGADVAVDDADGLSSESDTRTLDEPVAASPSVASPSTLYLEDLDDSLIVKEPHWVWESDGRATINGVEYLDSVLYQFQNCSECDESLEFIVPAGYSRLTGTVGLDDSSRHDDVIDGIVNFAIYDTSGNQILPTTVIEYPQAVPVDVTISGQTRLRIEMTRGSNDETFVLGNMALVQ